MQATRTQEKTQQWLTTTATLFIIGIAIVLFGVVIGRLGIFNRLDAGETAVVGNTHQMEAEAMRFGASELRVKAGEPVVLSLDNHDLYGHSFDVDALDLHVEMPANSQIGTSFTPKQPGTYTIYCNVPGHREAGMVSSLVVE